MDSRGPPCASATPPSLTALPCSNCAPTDPPDGKLYLQASSGSRKEGDRGPRVASFSLSAPFPSPQVVFEECGVPGGTQLTLLPWAVIGIIVYTIGYPAFIAQVRGAGGKGGERRQACPDPLRPCATDPVAQSGGRHD